MVLLYKAVNGNRVFIEGQATRLGLSQGQATRLGLSHKQTYYRVKLRETD